MVRRAWYAAYVDIYSRAQMDAVFDGRLEQDAPWSERRSRSLGSLIAEVDGVIVGIASCALLRDGDGEVVALYVLPERQGCGIGGALWRAAAAALAGRGCRRLWVWVLERNLPARRWYARRGCEEVDSGPFALGAHVEPCLGLVVNLDPSV